MVTVCIHGLGTRVNISSCLCKHSQLLANLYRHPSFQLNFRFSAEQEILKHLQAVDSPLPTPFPFPKEKRFL